MVAVVRGCVWVHDVLATLATADTGTGTVTGKRRERATGPDSALQAKWARSGPVWGIRKRRQRRCSGQRATGSVGGAQ
ncbi:hypothetical protein J1614_011857 [Plenodomus biglobosus]|nr:hypothetical protein J1614_011857 [Plenodomus biglobosus]